MASSTNIRKQALEQADLEAQIRIRDLEVAKSLAATTKERAKLEVQISKERLNQQKLLAQIAKLEEDSAKAGQSALDSLQDQLKALEKKRGISDKTNEYESKSADLQARIAHEIQHQTGNLDELLKEYKELNKEVQEHVKLLQAAEESASNVLDDITGSISRVPLIGGALSKGFKSYLKSPKGQALSKQIATKLFNPAAIGQSQTKLGLLGASAAMIGAGLKLAVRRSEALKDIRRTLGLTTNEAKEFRSLSSEMLSDSNSMATSQKEILEAASQLSDVYGTTVQNNRKLVDNQITLTKGFGLQAEEAEKISMLADATGQSYTDQLKSTVATAQATGKVYKFNFNTNKVLADVAKLSASIQASFKGSAAEMSKAVIQTKLMGTSLQQLDGVADNLLQIESSIENQVTAQLVTGKNINLETARMLALNNDLVGVGQELVNQGIDYATFSKMNRVEMQATAAAMGMQKDEFADMLLKQEVYRRAGADIAATDLASVKANEAKIDLLAAQGDAEAYKYIQSQKQLSVQEKMTAAMEKFSTIMENIYYIFIGIGVALAAMTFGLSLLPAIGAGILGGIALRHAPVVQDGIAPASSGPFTITDRKGNIGVTSTGDGLIATPNKPGAGNSTPIVNVSLVVGNTAIREIGNKVAMSNSYNAGVGNSYNRLAK